MRHEAVEPGQLRGWVDGSGKPFMITHVDRTKKVWNCEFLLADGNLSRADESTIRDYTRVINESR